MDWNRVFGIHIAVEIIENLRYKFRCFGVDIGKPSEIRRDYKSVVTN